MRERISWIDLARGIAIVLVVVGHVVSSYHMAGLYTENDLFNFTHQFVYSFHMALFMMLSGYLASKTPKKGKKSVQVYKKLISYGIPYIVFSCVWVAMKLAVSGVTNRAVSLNDLLWIPVYPISFMWFIYALMIMQIIQVFVPSDNRTFKAIHMGIAGIGYFIQPYLASTFEAIRFSDCIINDVLKFYIFFLIGVYLLDHVLKKIEEQQVAAINTCGFFLVAGNAMAYTGAFSSNRLVDLVIALAGSIFVIEICIFIAKSRFFEYLGRNSLPIYTLQGSAIAASRLGLTKLGLNILYGTVPLILCTVLGCFLPLCAYWISKKIWKLDGLFYPTKYIKIK